jgi:citrate synthase
MSDNFGNTINTKIWSEQAEPDNPFTATVCRCHGYDVYGDILGKASYPEFLFLLFKGERPSPNQARVLELLAIALANPGPRDPSVHAAMAAYVSGTPAASALIGALAVGAGSHLGAREVRLAVEHWQLLGQDLQKWQTHLQQPPQSIQMSVWPKSEHPPGFDPYGKTAPLPVIQTMDSLINYLPINNLAWLHSNYHHLENHIQMSLNLLGVAAATLSDLAFSPEEAEMLTMLLRLPGAAVHALEQRTRGFRQFPFFDLELEHDPANPTQQVIK